MRTIEAEAKRILNVVLDPYFDEIFQDCKDLPAKIHKYMNKHMDGILQEAPMTALSIGKEAVRLAESGYQPSDPVKY